ncbi:MAG TPA: SDR family oxidoreductase [Blastocatellia bacterium]|nr:SDR family oxidoreductase [Blastocatellia bacterium]
MAFVLVAGASGKVGQAVMQELKQQGHRVRALVRNQAKLEGNVADEVVTADATQPNTLQGVCDGVDVVISAIGGSLQLGRTKGNGGYWEVDYQANKNLLAEANRAGVRKFIYVSVYAAQQVKGSAYFEAHAAFENELQRSGLSYALIRPTGIFYIFEEFVNLARKGIVPLIGDGSANTNPIDERDVARVCVAAIDSTQTEFDIGGPDVMTRRNISELCFKALDKKPRFIQYPVGLMRVLIKPLKLFDQRLFDLMDFAIVVNNRPFVAPQVGTSQLESYLRQLTARG